MLSVNIQNMYTYVHLLRINRKLLKTLRKKKLNEYRIGRNDSCLLDYKHEREDSVLEKINRSRSA